MSLIWHYNIPQKPTFLGKPFEGLQKGLKSPPGIAETSVVEYKIDQSVMSAGAANNKIPGITKYNNFSLILKACTSGKLPMLERAGI